MMVMFLTLPSPKKTRNSLKLNSEVSTSKIKTVHENNNSGKKTISRALLTLRQLQIIHKLLLKILMKIHKHKNLSLFPQIRHKSTSLWPELPDFTSSERPSNLVDTFQRHTPYSIFNLFFLTNL